MRRDRMRRRLASYKRDPCIIARFDPVPSDGFDASFLHGGTKIVLSPCGGTRFSPVIASISRAANPIEINAPERQLILAPGAS